jgi:hypothetical protein
VALHGGERYEINVTSARVAVLVVQSVHPITVRSRLNISPRQEKSTSGLPLSQQK